MKKIAKYFALLLVLLPLFTVKGNHVSADEVGADSVTVFLHKIIFPNGEMPEDIANTGDMTGTHQDLLQEYRGLNEVTFEAYDMTAQFYELRAEGATVEEAQLALSQLSKDELGTALATDITREIEGEDGTAMFTLPATDKEGRDAVYLFHEGAAPEIVAEKAKNMVVVLPIYTATEEQLSTLHLYPKNEKVVHETPPFEKVVVEQGESYQFGDVLTYEIATKVPLDILDYTKFEVSDASDPGLVYQAASLKVSIEDESIMPLVDLEETESGFTAKFTDFKALHEYAGKELVFQYQMQLVDVKTETNIFNNRARLVTDFDELDREVEVKTGGKRFVKVDLTDDAILLSGAKFQIRNKENQFLSKTDVGYAWTTDSKAENLIVVESGEKGQFEINGLSFGEYFLEETVAPSGYELSTTPVSFTVSDGSYTAGDAGILKVVNLKTPEKPITPETPKDESETPRKSLPKTGETKNSSFIWLGVILLTGVAIVLWRKKEKRSE